MGKWPGVHYNVTAMIICKGVQKQSRGWENGQGGALYDTAMIICKGGGGAKTVRGVRKQSGGALYNTAMIILRGCENSQGEGVEKRPGGCII